MAKTFHDLVVSGVYTAPRFGFSSHEASHVQKIPNIVQKLYTDMGKRERVGDGDHPRPRKRRCRRVHFREDVKKHDGLRPDTRIFEEVRT